MTLADGSEARGDRSMEKTTGTNNTAIIVVLVMFLVVALGVGVFAYRGQIFGHEEPKKVEINITTPEPPK
jgi:hypothetical protein